MSVTRTFSLTQQVIDLWKARKAKDGAPLYKIDKNDAQLLRTLTETQVKQRVKAKAAKELLDQLHEDLSQLEAKIQTCKDGTATTSPELQALMQRNKNKLSAKQLAAFDSLAHAFIMVKATAPGMIAAGNVEDARKKLTTAVKQLDSLFLKVMKSQLWGFTKAIGKIYTQTLEINPSDYKKTTTKTKVSGHSAKITKALNKGQLLKQANDQFAAFISDLPDNKKISAWFNHQLKKHKALLEELIDTSPSTQHWQKPENIIKFFHLLSQENLAVYLKNQINADRKDKNTATSDVVRNFMHKNGFKIQAEQRTVLRLAKALFEGENGPKMRAKLQTTIAAYSIYNGLLEMLAQQTPADRERVFTNLLDEVTKNQWEAQWDQFFALRPDLNIGTQLNKSEGPVDHAILWAFRTELAKEKNPVFAQLNSKVNALYVSKEQLEKLAKQKSQRPELSLTIPNSSSDSVPGSTCSTEPPSPTSKNRNSLFGFEASKASSLQNSSLGNTPNEAMNDCDSDNEENNRIFYLP